MSDYMIDVVVRMFDLGFDTAAISAGIKRDQSVVERWLHIGLERRRRP